jgi:hypothetical protein
VAFSNPCWSEDAKEKFFVTRDGGKSWSDITRGLNGVKWFNISGVVVDPGNAERVFVSFTNASVSKVMMSENAGAVWNDFSGSLPVTADIDCMVYDSRSDKIIIGTYSGVWTSPGGNPGWKKLGKGLPVVMVSDLEIRYDTYVLYAGTHGCGVWKIKLP